MEHVTKVSVPDHWLVETGFQWEQKFLCLMKLDRTTGESTLVQKIEAAGHWCYIPKGNLLFAGRFEFNAGDARTRKSPNLVYECFELSSNKPLWALPQDAAVLWASVSHDGNQLIVLHGGPRNPGTNQGPSWLSWYDARSGKLTRKVDLPGANSVQLNRYERPAIADAPEVTYVSRHSEDSYQCLQIGRQSEAAEPMSDGDDGFDGSESRWFIEMSDDSKWLAFHNGERVRLFKRTGMQLAEVKEFDPEVTPEKNVGNFLRNVRFTPRSSHLVVGSLVRTTLFNLETRKIQKEFMVGTENSDVTSDGSLLVLWHDGGSWSVEINSGKVLSPKNQERGILHDSGIDELVFSPDGKHLISGDGTHFIVWDLATGKALASLASPKEKDPDFRSMTSPVIVPGHGKVYGVDCWDVLEWDLAKIQQNLQMEPLVGVAAFGRAGNAERQGYNMDVAVDASGERFVETNARTLWYFNRKNPANRMALNIGKNDVFKPRRFHIPAAADVVMVSTLGKSMLVDLNGTDPHIDLKKTASILTASGMAYTIDDSRGNPRRPMVSRYPVGDDDAVAGDQIEVVNPPAVFQWPFIDATENSRFFVYKNGSTPGDEISVVDWDKKEVVRIFQSPALIKCLKTSPDGRYVAVAGSDRQIYLWDLSGL